MPTGKLLSKFTPHVCCWRLLFYLDLIAKKKKISYMIFNVRKNLKWQKVCLRWSCRSNDERCSCGAVCRLISPTKLCLFAKVWVRFAWWHWGEVSSLLSSSETKWTQPWAPCSESPCWSRWVQRSMPPSAMSWFCKSAPWFRQAQPRRTVLVFLDGPMDPWGIF